MINQNLMLSPLPRIIYNHPDCPSAPSFLFPSQTERVEKERDIIIGLSNKIYNKFPDSN
jgi:hypothetical protein